ncbi:hypothetical protein GCM10009836_18520 [Pseudonocardia ailaonensis]|uniref:Copper chaperone PCu(A)C n=1 Tax=Pseudonocardia ailaonensis TaxID=367279 RepID=A0ABN2MXV7_9PSEU
MSRAIVTPERSRARRGSRTVRLLAAGGVAVAALALAGCGAGQIAQTSLQVSAVGGANGTTGFVAVRNAEIAFPAGVTNSGAAYRTGGTAPVAMTIVNTGNTSDRLLSASSPAGSVTVTGEQNLSPQLSLVSGDQGSTSVPGTKRFTIEITGLREDVLSGRTYPLTLTFANAGNVQVDLPVALPSTPRQDQPAEGGGH